MPFGTAASVVSLMGPATSPNVELKQSTRLRVSKKCVTSSVVTWLTLRISVKVLQIWDSPSMAVSTHPTSGCLLPTAKTHGTSSIAFSTMPTWLSPQAKDSEFTAKAMSASPLLVLLTTVALLSIESRKSSDQWNNSSTNVVWR